MYPYNARRTLKGRRTVCTQYPAGDAKLGPEHRTINNLVHVAGRATGEQRDAASRQESKHSSGDAAASEHSQALGIHRCSNLFKLFVLILINVTYFLF